MSTEPVTNIVPSVQAPQTNFGILQHSAQICRPNGQQPGEIPDMLIHMSRAQLISYMSLTSDTVVGTDLTTIINESAIGTNYFYPIVPRSTAISLYRANPIHTCTFYFNQSVYWNAETILHFWAVKPPQSVGRLRIIYTPPEYVVNSDASAREISEEWDLSASNIFEFRLPTYSMRNYRQCAYNYAALNGVADTFRTPFADIKHGRVRVNVTHIYQPGSIFPSNCTIYIFQSFQKPQFATCLGPAIPTERTCLRPVQ